MNCKNCQYPLESNARFCPNCGTAVPLETPHFEESTTPILPIEESEGIDFPATTASTFDAFPVAEIDPALTETAELTMPAPSIAPPAPHEALKAAPSQHTMDSIDLAIAHDIEQGPTKFEDPPLYIPETKRRKAPIFIALLLLILLAGVGYLFLTGTITLPNFSNQNPLSLTKGKTTAAFSMTQQELEATLGVPLSQTAKQSQYQDGIHIIYRGNRAVQLQLGSTASKRWKTSEGISIGDSRSDIFKAYGTDNLVSVLQTMDRLDDPSKISQLDEYLIPYQTFDDGTIGQINTLNRDNYESNPDAYYWIAIHVDSEGIVDNISLGDSSGVFYHE